MNDYGAVEAAIAKLATALRRSQEDYFRAQELMKVDREEAINNLDAAFEAKLEAFHSLYDVSKDLFAFHEHPDTALVIALRNAIHHRNHPLFRTLLDRLFLDDGVDRWVGAVFLIGLHPSSVGGPIAINHRLRLDDIEARLDPAAGSPYFDTFTKKAAARFALIDQGLNLEDLRRTAKAEGYPTKQVYLDVMPVFVSAVRRVFETLQASGVPFRGFDAEVYRPWFTKHVAIDLSRLEYQAKPVPIWLAGMTNDAAASAG